MKIRPDHRSKVWDALTVLKSGGKPHYRTDIARYTGLPMTIVTAVVDQIEREAIAAPKGPALIPRTLFQGKSGGIAATPIERETAARQRNLSLQSQLERDERRNATDYLREPMSIVWAKAWATSALRAGRETFVTARRTIDLEHLQALLNVKPALDLAEVVRLHAELMEEIDRI